MMISKTIFVASFFLTLSFAQNDIRMPPSITRGPPRNLIFGNGDSVKLDCEGKGVPDVTYEWTKNGIILNQNLRTIHRDADGTITILPATSMDEGFYQCFVKNRYGTALSITAHVQTAFLDFAVRAPAVLSQYVFDGLPFNINCGRCRSFPKPTYIWEISNDPQDSNPIQLVPTERMQIAENGDLHFGYGPPPYYRNEKYYRCFTYNPYLRIKDGGNYTRLNLVSRRRRQSFRTIDVSAESATVALIGGSVTFRCFFYENPVPTISWLGPQDTLPTGRYTQDIFNTSLTIDNINASDEGPYICNASTPDAIRWKQFYISIEAVPIFPTVNDAPYDVNVTEGDSFTFRCNPEAKPAAMIVWLKDGKQLDPNNPPTRFAFSTDLKSLTIRDVCRDCVDRESKTDLMVIQCNASNVHGYAFAQGYLNVQAYLNVRYTDFNYTWIWISIGVTGFVIVLVGIFCAVFRSTRNKRAEQCNTSKQATRKSVGPRTDTSDPLYETIDDGLESAQAKQQSRSDYMALKVKVPATSSTYTGLQLT